MGNCSASIEAKRTGILVWVWPDFIYHVQAVMTDFEITTSTPTSPGIHEFRPIHWPLTVLVYNK